jgi:hypothetical protein
MKILKLMGISVTLLGVLSMTAFAGDTSSPPCAPGDTSSPPCAMAQVTSDEPEDVTEGVAPATASESSYAASEVAVDLLQSVLLLF